MKTSGRPKRRWGQNFLIDPNIVRKILDCADIQPSETIVEIGPGRGILTKSLLDRGACVTAIEIDHDLAGALEEEMESSDPAAIEQNSRLTLICEDALRYPFDKMTSPYKVVANLPYNISTPILFRLLEERRRISKMVLMLQKEVAERMVAELGGKSYGALSIILQYYADLEIAFMVSPACFRPRPKVFSAVVCLKSLASPRIFVKDETLFLSIIKGAFQYRRKQLVNALGASGFSEAAIRAALDEIRCEPTRRGETYSMAEFAALSDAVGRYHF